MKTAIAFGLFALIGCGADERRPDPEPPLAQLDLRAAMQTTENVTPIGLAIAPDGKRYVFDENAGLYRIEGTVAVLVVPMSAMPDPGPTAPIKPPFTDIVAIAPNVFAVTAIGDGYLLDTSAMTLTQHFCYLPGEGGGTPVALKQRTDGIAFDPANDRIYAQPITYDAADVFQYAQVATYDLESGVDTAWYSATPDVAATGMIVIAEIGLVLGQGSRLTRFDEISGTAFYLDDLTRFGVQSIDGLAIDAAAGTLVVVDKKSDTLFDIEIARLAF